MAGLWQPVLWEGEALSADTLKVRLEELGLVCDPIKIEALPSAKHIFSHIEWRMTGFSAEVPPQNAPNGFLWASREQLREEYTLPGAFKAYKKRLGL